MGKIPLAVDNPVKHNKKRLVDHRKSKKSSRNEVKPIEIQKKEKGGRTAKRREKNFGYQEIESDCPMERMIGDNHIMLSHVNKTKEEE